MNLRSGEWAAADAEIKKSYKTTLESCKNDCNQDEECSAMYYIHKPEFCFIIYIKTPTLSLYAGSSYFNKVCNHTYSKF